MALNHPENQEKINNNPILKFILQNPQLMFNPQFMQMTKNMFKKEEKNQIDSSSSGIFVPPGPFESLNNNQINQMMNSPSQIPNINTFNNNNIGNNGNFINNEIKIDYKEKYKEELSKLKNMGFTNEEANIQALKQFNGNIV